MTTLVLTYEDLRSSSNTTMAANLQRMEDAVSTSVNVAKIALDMLSTSLSDISPELLLQDFEETRQAVFERNYGSGGT